MSLFKTPFDNVAACQDDFCNLCLDCNDHADSSVFFNPPFMDYWACEATHCGNCYDCQINFATKFEETFTDPETCKEERCHDCNRCDDGEYSSPRFFLEPYESVTECQASECVPECSNCFIGDRYGSIAFFIPTFDSQEECVYEICNNCTSCEYGFATQFTEDFASIQECQAAMCHNCRDCGHSFEWDPTDYAQGTPANVHLPVSTSPDIQATGIHNGFVLVPDEGLVLGASPWLSMQNMFSSVDPVSFEVVVDLGWHYFDELWLDSVTDLVGGLLMLVIDGTDRGELDGSGSTQYQSDGDFDNLSDSLVPRIRHVQVAFRWAIGDENADIVYENIARITEVYFGSDRKEASFDKRYENPAECAEYECGHTCSDCTSMWDNFPTVYKSLGECQANECGDCSKCVDDYDSLDFFVTAHASTEDCQMAECNKCGDCLANGGSAKYFVVPNDDVA